MRIQLVIGVWIALLVGGVASACSGSSTTTVTETKSRTQTPATAPALASTTRVYANSSAAVLFATPEPLLVIPKIGSLTASCAIRTGRLSDRFTLASITATSSLEVSISPGAVVRGTDTARSLAAPTGPSAAVAQTWQITPTSSGSIQVATIWVTAQPAPAGVGHQGCVAAAQAIVTTSNR